MKTANDLRSRLGQLKRDGPSRDASEAIVMRLRVLLEHHKLGGEYPTLQLMCHWVAHASLRESSTIYDWLARVTNAMRFAANSDETGRYAALIRTGASSLNLDGLRGEVRTVLLRLGHDPFLVDEQAHWYEFVCGLLGLICEKTIGLPDDRRVLSKPARRYVQAFGALAATSDHHDAAATSIDVYVEDGKFRLHLATNSSTHWSFIVASFAPFIEYDAGSISTSEWVTAMHAKPMAGISPMPGLQAVMVAHREEMDQPAATHLFRKDAEG